MRLGDILVKTGAMGIPGLGASHYGDVQAQAQAASAGQAEAGDNTVEQLEAYREQLRQQNKQLAAMKDLKELETKNEELMRKMQEAEQKREELFQEAGNTLEASRNSLGAAISNASPRKEGML
jgi:hypothetical protein